VNLAAADEWWAREAARHETDVAAVVDAVVAELTKNEKPGAFAALRTSNKGKDNDPTNDDATR